MRHPVFPDVVVRARGLATHLLEHRTLLRLARASGSGALASALEDVGYWPAPSPRDTAPTSVSDVMQRRIDHGTAKRLAVLTHWLGDRAVSFAGLFELDLRDALRIRLRATHTAPVPFTSPPPRAAGAARRDPRSAILETVDLDALLRTLTRMHSPYAAPLAATRARAGDDARALEAAVDRTWALRASAVAHRGGQAVSRWVRDEIDLQNAWDALVAGDGVFVPGGDRVTASQHQAIASEPDASVRRRQLAAVFGETALGGVFDDPDLALDALEARARKLRIETARRTARLDPLGAGAIVEVVLRFWTERANLRCIVWGIAAGLAYETITARLVSAA